MKKSILYLAFLTLSFPIIFSACKKNSTLTNIDSAAQVSVQTDDQSRVFDETGAISNDANVALEASPGSITGREMSTQAVICDATIVTDTLSNPRTITVTYNGTNCLSNRSRKGVVVISVAAGVRWKNAGAAITLTYQNLKITRLSDNKSITINGSHTITNVTGGLLVNLSNLQSITHTIASSSMSVTFDDGTQQTWQVARQQIFTYNNGVVISIRGFHTDGANTGIEEWGTTRFGNVFISSIREPMVIRQDCSFRLVSGTFKHQTVLGTTTAVFGLNASGVATSCPGTGSYYLKAEWTGVTGKTFTVILPY